MAKICPYILTNFSAMLTKENAKEMGSILAIAMKNTYDENFPDEDDDHYHMIAGIQLLITCKEDSCGKYNLCSNRKGE